MARRRGRSRRWCRSSTLADARYPMLGASLQRRGGTARHDAVAWGYARAADAARRGHHPELRSHRHPPRRRRGQRCRDHAAATSSVEARSACVAAGHSSGRSRRWLDLRLPIESHPLQALVSEPIKPIARHCVVMSNAVHGYISQSDKGELVIGAGIDQLHRLQRSAAASTSSSTHAGGDRRAVSDLQRACG